MGTGISGEAFGAANRSLAEPRPLAYQGVWPSFFGIRERTPSDGVVFQDEDNTAAARVVVLGQSTATQLFGDESAVGKTVIMNNRPFQVIGVPASKGTGGGGIDRDDAAIIPLGTAFRTFDGRHRVSDIMCMVDKPEATNLAQIGIAAVLRVRHRLGPDAPDDFQIQQPIEFLQMRQQAAETMGFMLTAARPHRRDSNGRLKRAAPLVDSSHAVSPRLGCRAGPRVSGARVGHGRPG